MASQKRRGLFGLTNTILVMPLVIIILITVSIFLISASQKQRAITSVTQTTADQFLINFLNSDANIGQDTIKTEVLIDLTINGLDKSYLETKAENDLKKVCKSDCYAELTLNKEIIAKVGNGRYKSKISSFISLPEVLEVSFYVPE